MAELSTGILLFIVPSLIFFIVMPVLLKRGLNFYLTLVISSGVMVTGYAVFSSILRGLVWGCDPEINDLSSLVCN